MILDKQNELSDQQAVTATAVSTNAYDLSQVRHVGDGKPLYLHVLVKEAAAAVGAATVTFEAVTDDGAALGTPTVIAASAAIPKATLVVGYEFYLVLPPGATYERYIGAQYTVATGPLTAGKFTTHITHEAPKSRVYADGFAIQ